MICVDVVIGNGKYQVDFVIGVNVRECYEMFYSCKKTTGCGRARAR